MKRLKKILKWTGIVLGGLVAIGLVANACFIWITDTRLERQLATIRAAGDPVTLADLARPPIPPEKNAATYLRQAEAGVDAITDEVYYSGAFSNGWGNRWAPGRPLPSEGVKSIKKALEAHPEVIPLLARAAACPDYDAQLDYTLSPEEFLKKLILMVQQFRDVDRVLECQMHLLVAEGKRDEAVQNGMLILRLTSHFDRNPTLVAYLVGTTVRRIAIDTINLALQSGPVSKQVRNVLDKELALQEPMKGFVWALRSERSCIPEMFPNLIPGRDFWLISRGVWNMQESACLDVFPTLVALASDPGPYCRVEKTLDSMNSAMTALLFPGLKNAYVFVAQVRAGIRSLRVLNALQTHAPAGSNVIPKLSELGLPADTTTDPFNGEPLHVKKLPQGWLVYSVGPNLQDDGGKVDDPYEGDVGISPLPVAAQPAKK